MYRGLTASLLLHLSVLAWALLSFQMTPHLDLPDVQPISVSIIQPSDVTRIKEGDPDAKELEAKAKDEAKPEQFTKEAPKPKPVTAPPPAAEPPPPPPEEAKAEPPKPEPPKEEPKADPIADKIAALPPPKPEPAPGPTPEEKKALEEKIEQDRIAAEQKKAEEQRKLEEQRKKEEEKKKAEEKKRKEEELKKKKEHEKKLADARRKAEEAKKKKFDADRIAALIDKSPDKKGGPTGASPPTKPTNYTGPTAGERGGKDSVLSAREQDLLAGMLKAQIAPCWRLPGAGGGTENPVVTLRWRLKPDGSLDGEPQLARPASGPLGGLANEAAIRAVKGCAPFKLPAEHYAAWKEVIWEFDPSKML